MGVGGILPAKRLSFHQRIHRSVPVARRRDVIDSRSVYTPPALREPRSSVHKLVPAFCSRRFLCEGAACAGRGGARWGGGKPVLAPAYPGSGRGGPGGARRRLRKHQASGWHVPGPPSQRPDSCLHYWWGPLRTGELGPSPAPRPARARAHARPHTHAHARTHPRIQGAGRRRQELPLFPWRCLVAELTGAPGPPWKGDQNSASRKPWTLRLPRPREGSPPRLRLAPSRSFLLGPGFSWN